MIQRPVYLSLLLASLLLLGCGTPELKIYVSPDGNDQASGTLSAPVKTLQRAAELSRAKAGEVQVSIYLSGGRYPLTSPLMLGPEEAGSTEAPVIWKARPGENPVICGGIQVNDWEQEEDGLWSTRLPDSYQGTFRSFYVNGVRATRARHPNDNYLRVGQAGEDKRTNFFFNENELSEIGDTEGLELVLLHDWSVTRIPVKSIDWKTKQLTAVDSIGARLPFFTLTHWEDHPRYYLENSREFCDHPGEWYSDFRQRRIYYHPAPGDRIEATTGIIPLAEKLIVIEGNKEQHAAYICFEGITFEHSAWDLP